MWVFGVLGEGDGLPSPVVAGLPAWWRQYAPELDGDADYDIGEAMTVSANGGGPIASTYSRQAQCQSSTASVSPDFLERPASPDRISAKRVLAGPTTSNTATDARTTVVTIGENWG